MNVETTASIIAAVSALSGVIVSQLGGILRSFFDKYNQRTALLRDKLEELADNVHKTTEWVDQLVTLAAKDATHVSSTTRPGPASLSVDARRVYVLSLLYFPELRGESQKFLNASHGLYLQITAKSVEEETLVAFSTNFSLAKKALDELIKIEAEKIT